MSDTSVKTHGAIGSKSNLARAPLANPVAGVRTDIISVAGRIALYAAGPETAGPPLLLIHSVNATSSAFEVKPLYDHYARERRVYAIDLPGFGQSERGNHEYTARLMTDALHEAVERIRELHGDQPVDALALSLSCEFLARAAVERPAAFRSLGFISPTGFERTARDARVPNNLGKRWLLDALYFRLWETQLFALLTTRPVMRKFLEKAWGSKQIDEPLLDYCAKTTRQHGARHAPYYFVAGYMFSKDALRLYETLQQPVWMVHGVRGDFVDYRHKTRVASRPNWRIVTLESGAFPHFEMLHQVTRSYDEALAPLAAPHVEPSMAAE
jgi:pimeloyl-ACP methyl ester carboxylesterase